MELPPNTVHLWTARLDEVSTPALWRTTSALLCAEERARFARYRVERARQEFLAGRWLVRTTLSRYLPRDPASWRFVSAAHGKPELAEQPAGRRLRFNLSHSRDVVALGVAWDHDLGVDVENARRRWAGLRLAERFFAAAEVRPLTSTPRGAQRQAFFRYWTLKESYIKACGLGMKVPLGAFAFNVQDPQRITVRFDPPLDDRPDVWRFAHLQLDESFHFSVALRTGGSAMQLQHHRVIVPGRLPAAPISIS